jgi:hypothetical protein
MHLDALHRIGRMRTEGSWIPNRAAPNPCRVAYVPECEDGYDWPSPCSHSRQCYSRHLSRLSSAAEGNLGRWVSHRTRQLGFKKLLLSQSHNSTMLAFLIPV